MRYDSGMRSIGLRMLDLLAVIVLLAYAWVAHYTQRGAADPVWTAIQQRGVLRVGTDPGFQPFAQERDGQFQGYDIDLVTELARRLNLRVEFVSVGYDALYDALSTRRVDLLAAALPLAPEQGWRARFSTAYLNAGQAIVARKGAGITQASDLTGRTVGVVLGSEGDTLARNLQRDLATMTVRSGFETTMDALAALATGELDAVITDTVSALSGEYAYPSLGIAHVLTFEPYVLAMPVEAYQLEQAINRTLEDMRKDQVFDRLNARWFRPEFLK
jgi:polar amino acid transport system substrate-binding protein